MSHVALSFRTVVAARRLSIRRTIPTSPCMLDDGSGIVGIRRRVVPAPADFLGAVVFQLLNENLLPRRCFRR